jgi:hypothetical protein
MLEQVARLEVLLLLEATVALVEMEVLVGALVQTEARVMLEVQELIPQQVDQAVAQPDQSVVLERLGKEVVVLLYHQLITEL